MDRPASYTAFSGYRRIARGDLASVLGAVGDQTALILDDRTGDRVEIDPRDSLETTLARFAEPRIETPAAAPARGRPRLGVTAKEVTLLPRHWDWLQTQPGGASATLRRLVDAARRDNQGAEQARRSHRALDRFLYLVAGDLPQFEEAYRAFYAGDETGFLALIEAWPADVRDHSRILWQAYLADRALEPA